MACKLQIAGNQQNIANFVRHVVKVTFVHFLAYHLHTNLVIPIPIKLQVLLHNKCT